MTYSWKLLSAAPERKKSGWRMRWPTTCETESAPIGHGRKSMLPLRRKGTAAAATPRGVWIHENETLPHKSLFVVQSRAIEIQEALGVHKKPRTKFLKHLVAVACLGV